MDFNSLMAKMRELDQPTVSQTPTNECGDPMGMPPAAPMATENNRPPPAHPSMTVNINAQGMDDIEGLLKLMTKVNPDMINQPAPPMPPLTPMPSISKPPMPLGNLDAGPLKMLPPDLDLDEPEGAHSEPDADNFGGPSDNDADNLPSIDMDDKGDKDDISVAQGDVDNDGDHDMDDHEAEKDDDEKKEEFANEPDEEYKDVDYMVNKLSGGMNRQKGTYPKVAGGDNPMQRMESTDLRASIKAELQRRLNEAKGV